MVGLPASTLMSFVRVRGVHVYPVAPAGQVDVMVVTQQNGMAAGTFTYTFPLVLSTLSSSSSSIAGGLTVTLTGQGFGNGPQNTTVSVGGVPATVLSSTSSSVVFITPPVGGITAPVVANVTVTIVAPDPHMRMPAFGSVRRSRALQRLARLREHAPELVPEHLFKLVRL